MDFDIPNDFASGLEGNASPGGHDVATGELMLPSTCEPPSEQNPPQPLKWVIFGALGHTGRLLVHTALTHGDSVTAVVWSQEHTKEELEQWQTDKVSWTACDVRIRESVASVLAESIERWGRIDVIANCVGYGVIGACEDQDEAEVKYQFDTNFFGVLHIIQCSLPYFREQQHGRYIIFSSTSGSLGVPGLGPFCATKYAVEGLIESIQWEVDCYNIKATLVEPGHVRRHDPQAVSQVGDNTTSGLASTVQLAMPKSVNFQHFKVKTASAPYEGPTAPAEYAKHMLAWLNDRQPTDPVRSAELVWQLAHCSYPPLRLLLGSFAVESVRDRLRSITEEIEDWKHLHFPSTMGGGAAGSPKDMSGHGGAMGDEHDSEEEMKEAGD